MVVSGARRCPSCLGDSGYVTMSDMETPALTLLVLDGVADDFESVESLRDHGEVAPYGLALVDELALIGAVRTLLSDGLIEAWEAAGDPVELVPVACPGSDDTSLCGYWFRWTAAGKDVWRDSHAILDAYYAEHPIGD
jgi:hypothetical protein